MRKIVEEIYSLMEKIHSHNSTSGIRSLENRFTRYQTSERGEKPHRIGKVYVTSTSNFQDLLSSASFVVISQPRKGQFT